MKNFLLISDAAKEVCVESHVLRYWEEELRLPIKRNELGHRYYTNEDVERFKQIKCMKERGLQLKAIKMILKNGELNLLGEKEPSMAIEIVEEHDTNMEDTVNGSTEVIDDLATKENESDKDNMAVQENMPAKENNAAMENRTEPLAKPEPVKETMTKEEKARKLMWLLQQMMQETLQENNKQLCNELKESMIKELDYQFRSQEEREEERDKLFALRNEQYYEKMDQLLRKKSRKKELFHKLEVNSENTSDENKEECKRNKHENKSMNRSEKGKGDNKKKRHFLF